MRVPEASSSQRCTALPDSALAPAQYHEKASRQVDWGNTPSFIGSIYKGGQKGSHMG